MIARAPLSTEIPAQGRPISHFPQRDLWPGTVSERAATQAEAALHLKVDTRHMHGSSFTGDCAQALDDLNVMLREVFGRQK